MKTSKRSKKTKEKDLSKKQFKFCTIRLGEHFFNRLNKHISILKKFHVTGYSRGQWINDAIRVKLEKEIHNNLISIDKFVNTRIEVQLIEMMNQQVKLMKKFNGSYSKQKWIAEALSEKLEEEEQTAKLRLKELVVSSKRELQKK